MIRLLLALTVMFFVTPAYALSIEEGGTEKTKTIEDYIKDYVDVPDGATDWKVFGTTQATEVKQETEDGLDWVYIKPTFTPEVEALDGTQITIKGFMFPLDGTEEQESFLLGPFPMSCPYQYHVGPALVLEVHADGNPVTFTYDAVVMTGTLELVEDDPEYSVFYRLKDAKQVKD